jgi:hypothetical protein
MARWRAACRCDGTHRTSSYEWLGSSWIVSPMVRIDSRAPRHHSPSTGWLKMRAFVAAFSGKIAATLFIAVCIALGFGPTEWAAMLLGVEFQLIGRAIFVLLAMATLAGLLWPYWRQPRLFINDAAQKAYETAESAGLSGVAYGTNQTPAERLRHIMNSLMTSDIIRFRGQRPPSTHSILIPKSELENLYPEAGSNDLTDVTGTKVEYINVTLDHLGFWRYLYRLRRDRL